MVPVLNRPFLEHTLACLKSCEVNDVILALGYLPESVRSYFGDGSGSGVRLTYVVEDNPLGTGGAVKNVEQYLDSTFLVLNGDIFSDIDIADMLAFHRGKGAKVTIALTWVDDPCPFGVVETDSEGRVERFVEKPSPDRVTTHWINAGIYIIEPEVLEHVPPNTHYMFERGLFPHLLELGEPVCGYSSSGYWLDMGTPQKYLGLNCDLLLTKAKTALIGGLTGDEVRCDQDVVIHPSAEVVGPVVIGDRCRIDSGACIKGPVVIGPDCHIGESAVIERAVLWGGVDAGAGVTVKHCILGTDTKIKDNDQVANCVITVEAAQEW
jgi:mannose-1-phosphate guanylyltransferase